MKAFLFTFVIAFFALNTQAQTTETVSIGTEYVNDVYYNLETGTETAAVSAEWDIAFNTTYLGSSILANDGKGIEILRYPHGNYTDWENFDQTGIDDWVVQHNSDSSWARGAFDHGAAGFNIGWGLYDPVTHIVTGEPLFVAKYPDGTYKKIWIVDLTNEIYTYKYADLDGSNEVEATLVKADYPERNFAYVSLQNDTSMDREPVNAEWDLLFTKYNTYIEMVGDYVVTGVLSNIDVEVLQVNDTPNDDAMYDGETFSDNISEIGYDWKVYDNGYVITEDLTYFVQARNGNIWKLIFTDFGGSANGNFVFSKELVGLVGIEENSSLTQLGMFPNPSSGLINLVYQSTASKPMQVLVYDITGKTIYSEQNTASQVGLNQTMVDLSNLENGIYIVELNNGLDRVHQRLIIE